MKSGVPQGSVLGPTLFNISMAGVAHELEKIGVGLHMYGDDIILYMSFSYRDVDGAFSVLQEGLSLVERWMKANRLQLNARKTGVYVLRPPKMKIPICPPPL